MDMESANKKRKWNTRRSLAAGVITLVACAVSLGMGRYAIAPYDVLRAICDLFTGSDTVSDTNSWYKETMLFIFGSPNSSTLAILLLP